MTLYRPSGRFKGQIKRLVVQGALVPVEPCSHGKIDRHIIGDSITSEVGSLVVYYRSCPGAGIGETP